MIPILAKESEREEQNEKRNYVKMKILRALKTEREFPRLALSKQSLMFYVRILRTSRKNRKDLPHCEDCILITFGTDTN